MTYIGTLDPHGADLPGELADVERWEDEVLETCERCLEPTGWGESFRGRLLCPPCIYYTQRGAYAIAGKHTA